MKLGIIRTAVTTQKFFRRSTPPRDDGRPGTRFRGWPYLILEREARQCSGSKTSVLFLVLLLAALAGGCSVSQPFVKIDYYQLDYPAPAAGKEAPLNVVVGVRRFGIGSMYDHDRLVVREKGMKIEQSYYRRWVTNPRMMFSDLLLRDLLATGSYKAVVMMPADVLADYEIGGFIQEVAKDVTGSAPKVVISADITLFRCLQGRANQERVIFQKSYTSELECKSKAAADDMAAMSLAGRDLFDRIVKDIYEGIKKSSASASASAPALPAPAPQAEAPSVSATVNQ